MIPRRFSLAGAFAVAAVSLSVAQVPPAPSLMSPDNHTTGIPLSLSFVWGPVSGASSYHLQISHDSLFATLMVSDTSTSFINEVEGLDASSVHFWRVRGRNAVGTGAWSSVYRFTTAGATGVLPGPVRWGRPAASPLRLRKNVLSLEIGANRYDLRGRRSAPSISR